MIVHNMPTIMVTMEHAFDRDNLSITAAVTLLQNQLNSEFLTEKATPMHTQSYRMISAEMFNGNGSTCRQTNFRGGSIHDDGRKSVTVPSSQHANHYN